MFEVTVTELDDTKPHTEGRRERYRQTVDSIDLLALTTMLNRKPRVYTKRAKKDAQPA